MKTKGEIEKKGDAKINEFKRFGLFSNLVLECVLVCAYSRMLAYRHMWNVDCRAKIGIEAPTYQCATNVCRAATASQQNE